MKKNKKDRRQGDTNESDKKEFSFCSGDFILESVS